MKKVHMGKNKSLVSSGNTQIDFYQFAFSPFLWCEKVLVLHVLVGFFLTTIFAACSILRGFLCK